MRRNYTILLIALGGFALLALGAQLIGHSSSSISSASAVNPADAPRSTAVGAVTVTSLAVTDVVEPMITDPVGAVAGAATTSPSVAANAGCAPSGHSAVVDRANQRTWLCNDGRVTEKFPMTSAKSQPDPGAYKVYAKDLNSSSMLTGKYSTMTHFVAFTKGKVTGARIAFHSIPKYSNGDYVQPLDSVGTPAKRGVSSGCIRVLYDDSVKIWDWLAIGDPVTVIS